MRCPTCSLELAAVGKFWICPEHGQVEPVAEIPAAAPAQQIFISYGRADTLDFARQLAEAIKQHGGHKVWLDLEGIEAGGLWEVRIEQAIRASSIVTAVMSKRSLEETSVCRDEVVFALNEGKRVLPLRADPDPTLKPPLLLARRNWIDFTASFEEGLDNLLQFLAGDESVLRQPGLPTVTGVMPLDFGVEIARYSFGFTGRHWLTREIDHWLFETDRRMLVIVGAPGMGKSAIAAWLSLTRDEVVGVHFCTQQSARSRNAQEFVANLVAQLAARLPAFAEAVALKQPEQRRPTARDAFRELLVEPARSLPKEQETRIVVVDSLDEAAAEEGETVVDLLIGQARDLPPWLRIVATTRPEEPIRRRLREMEVFELLAERAENRSDVAEYLAAQLSTEPLAGRVGVDAALVTTRLEELSEGNFLYACLALQALERGALTPSDLDRLSPGLEAFYTEAFSRRFPDLEEFSRSYAPLLRILAAARSPLPLTVLESASGETLEDLNRRLHDLGSYLRSHRERDAPAYTFFHKSLPDWLCDRAAAGRYWCDHRAGHDRLAEVLSGLWRSDTFALTHLPAHLAAAGHLDRLAELLCDLEFVQRKCAAGMTYDLMSDYQLALDALPEAQEERDREHIHAERLTTYAANLMAFARDETSTLDPIPSVEPVSENQLRADSDRIRRNPTRLDRIRAFSQFVAGEAHALVRHGNRPGFVAQHAYNLASDGPVAAAAEPLVEREHSNVLLLRHPASRRRYNPHPGLLRTLAGHGKDILDLSITADGRCAISGSADHTVRIWDLETGRSLRVLEGHTAAVNQVSATPDGSRVLSSDRSGALRLWAGDTGRCLNAYPLGGGHWMTRITPDGRLAVVSGSAHARLLDLESGQFSHDFSADLEEEFRISGNRRRVVSARWGSVRVYDLERVECIRFYSDFPGFVHDVAVTLDGERIVSVHEKSIGLWDTETQVLLRGLEAEVADLRSMAIAADGLRVLTLSSQGIMRLLDLEGCSCLRTFRSSLGPVSRVGLTADARRAVSASGDSLQVWDLDSGYSQESGEAGRSPVTAVEISPEGKQAVSLDTRGDLQIWDIASGQCAHRIETGLAERFGLDGAVAEDPVVQRIADITSYSISGDGRLAVTVQPSEALCVWDLDTGACIQEVPLQAGSSPLDGEQGIPNRINLLTSHSRFSTTSWTDVVLAADGSKAILTDASHSSDSSRLWDIETGALRSHWSGRCVGISPDGLRLAILGIKGLSLFKTDGSRRLRRVRTAARLAAAMLGPDAAKALTAAPGGLLHLWDLDSGQREKTLFIERSSHQPEGSCLSDTLATGTDESHGYRLAERFSSAPFSDSDARSSVAVALNLLQPRSHHTGAVLTNRLMRASYFTPHAVAEVPGLLSLTDPIRCLALSADGRRAMVGFEDGAVGVLELGDAERITLLQPHSGPVNQVCLTADGAVGLSIGNEELRVWDLDSGSCSWKVRPASTACVSRDGRRILSRDDDTGALRLWDLQTGACLRVLGDCGGSVWPALSLTQEGSRAVFGVAQNMFVQTLSGDAHPAAIHAHEDAGLRLTLAPDGRMAASVGRDRTLRVLDLATHSCVKTLLTSMPIATGHYTPDGKCVVIVGGEEDLPDSWSMEVWNIDREEIESSTEAWSILVTPDGRRIVREISDEVRLEDIHGGSCSGTVIHAQRLHGVTPDGRYVVCDIYGGVGVFSLDSGENIAVCSEALYSLVIGSHGPLVGISMIGEILFFEGRNLPTGAGIVTPIRLWRHGNHGGQGEWENEISVRCPWCHALGSTPVGVLDAIAAIGRSVGTTPSSAPCLELPAEAWEEARLLLACQECGRPLKANPFLVDNRGVT